MIERLLAIPIAKSLRWSLLPVSNRKSHGAARRYLSGHGPSSIVLSSLSVIRPCYRPTHRHEGGRGSLVVRLAERTLKCHQCGGIQSRTNSLAPSALTRFPPLGGTALTILQYNEGDLFSLSVLVRLNSVFLLTDCLIYYSIFGTPSAAKCPTTRFISTTDVHFRRKIGRYRCGRPLLLFPCYFNEFSRVPGDFEVDLPSQVVTSTIVQRPFTRSQIFCSMVCKGHRSSS